jgi:hypothetical protein
LTRAIISSHDARLNPAAMTSFIAALDHLFDTDYGLGNVVEAVPDIVPIPWSAGGNEWLLNRQPHRARRPGGDGRILRPRDAPIFLENVLARGKQCWLRFRIGEAELVALSNPSPHLKRTITVTTLAEEHQTWRATDRSASREKIRRLSGLAVKLALISPHRYVSFNGSDAGNSLPQFHFCVNQLPESVPRFPIERVTPAVQSNRLHMIGRCQEYPFACVAIEGSAGYVAQSLSAVIRSWDTESDRTGNFMVRHDLDTTRAFFWPRMSSLRRSPEFASGEIAFMELSGFLLVSALEDLSALEVGSFSHERVCRILQSVCGREARDFAARWTS